MYEQVSCYLLCDTCRCLLTPVWPFKATHNTNAQAAVDSKQDYVLHLSYKCDFKMLFYEFNEDANTVNDSCVIHLKTVLPIC